MSQARKDGCTQPEAFCVMEYQCKKEHRVLIWNSRDGVTPFIISCPIHDCGEESQHIMWQKDHYCPAHKPATGDYVFVDLTIEMALAYRLQYVERNWCDDMKEMFGTKMKAIERLAKGDMESFAPHTPHLTRWE